MWYGSGIINMVYSMDARVSNYIFNCIFSSYKKNKLMDCWLHTYPRILIFPIWNTTRTYHPRSSEKQSSRKKEAMYVHVLLTGVGITSWRHEAISAAFTFQSSLFSFSSFLLSLCFHYASFNTTQLHKAFTTSTTSLCDNKTILFNNTTSFR